MTSFAKRHYQALAEAMQTACPAEHWDPNKRAQWQVCRDRLADMLAQANGRFDRDRFARACEPGANVRARSSNPEARDMTWPAPGPLSERLQALRANREAAE